MMTHEMMMRREGVTGDESGKHYGKREQKEKIGGMNCENVGKGNIRGE